MTESKIKGLEVVYNFISAEYELQLIADIESVLGEPMNKSRGGRSIIKRWGSAKPYNNFVSPHSTPEFLSNIAQRLVDERYLGELPDSISINGYLPGEYIAPHIDSVDSGAVITVLSLLAKAEMTLEKGLEKIEVPLPPRTLLQLSDALRWDWKHSIHPVTSKRYSIVFRCSKT